MGKERLDQLLVNLALCEDLQTARREIMAGNAVVDEQRIDKPGTLIDESSKVRLKAKSRFVSRAGEKLASAIESFGIAEQFKNAKVLDVGASTGGFTDCALQLGASSSVAVDVGQNQLAWSLRNHPDVICHDQTDIRDFDPSPFLPFDWILGDVSFNSIARLASDLAKCATPNRTCLLVLIKPQFELPRGRVGKGGIVAAGEERMHAVSLADQALREAGFKEPRWRDSQVAGKKGNREVFYLAKF